jgi:hypothetical protein
MAMNKCVIVSDGPGVGDVLTDQAAIVPPEDVQELAKQIKLLWDDDTKRNEFASRGQAYAEVVGGDGRFYRDVLRVSCEGLANDSYPTDVAVRQTLPMTAAIGVRQTSEDA